MEPSIGKVVRLVALVAVLGTLFGCGGGGGSHSGPSHVGTYVGTADTVLASSKGSTPVQGAIQVVVAADNTVSFADPGKPPYAQGTLSGNTFTAIAPGSFINSPGVSCGGTVAFNGTIAGISMNGSIASTGLSCNGVAFNLAGTFTASLQGELPKTSSGDEGAVHRLKDALRSQ